MRIPGVKYRKKQRYQKYNLKESGEYEDLYCQNSNCQNGNRIKKDSIVRGKYLIFCSKICLEEVSSRILIDE